MKFIFLILLTAFGVNVFAQENEQCETAIFNSGDLKSDSTKMKIISRATIDSGECLLSGNVIDRNSLKPIADAIIIMLNEKGQNIGVARTNKGGKFKISSFGFTRKLGSIIVRGQRHKCLSVMYFQFRERGDKIDAQIMLQNK